MPPQNVSAALPERFELVDKTVVVTGASRGIGLELARQLLAKNNHVIAAVRNVDGSPALKQLKADHAKELSLMALDVGDPQSVAAWGTALRGEFDHIDVVINNAGIMGERQELEDVCVEDMMECFNVNCVGQVLVVQTLLKNKLLPPGSLIANITSLVASITENGSGGVYAYRCSKIAANMATKSMSIDLEPRGITCTILHPGYVRTDMTAGNGLIDADESVRGMLDVLESGKPLHGEWYHTSGRHLPW